MLVCCGFGCLQCVAMAATGRPVLPADTVKPQQADTTPRARKHGLFRQLGQYRDSLRNKQYRESFIRRITKQDMEEPPEDSTIIKSEAYFTPYAGKIIRDIYYRKVQVFGPRSINDTTFSTTMKLIHLANRLHYDSRQWVIRQSLFFRENDTLQPFEMADNERYLRNRPFIQDARVYVINTGESPDSVDVLVVTKDIFEYGVNLSQLSASNIEASVSNNNLFGAGQGMQVGFSWRNNFSPQWRSEVRYTKYNIGGSFVDVSAGYSTLNNTTPLDTNVYEGSYYVNIQRPLYRSSARLVGGLVLASNYSMNVRQFPDSVYRDYGYYVIDAWLGYNIINHSRKNGLYVGKKPNLAILFRHYNLSFNRRPDQPVFRQDPVYNNHRYYVAAINLYRQNFFKAHHFFGFGRTEDIPLGYTYSATSGWESWLGRRRMYTGVEAQKFWTTRRQGLFNTTIGVSSFWQHAGSEDAVIHARMEYYSRLFSIRKARFRQFVTTDFLAVPNAFFYKPVGINMEYGIWGYRGVLLTGYQRLNLSSETVYYSPVKLLGFKFNFFTSLQATMLSSEDGSLFRNPIYTGIGAGCRIKNENLSLNTIKISGYYYPNAPAPMKNLLLEITTIVDFRFDISTLKAPGFLSFR